MMEEFTIPDGMPVPTGTRILVRMWKAKAAVTGSGLYMPETRVADENNAMIKAQVLAMGADAYRDNGGRLPISGPYCAVGDWVLLASFAGNRFTYAGDDTDYRIIQDTAVIAVVPDPEKIERFCHA